MCDVTLRNSIQLRKSNFKPLEVVDHSSETQPQVVENLNNPFPVFNSVLGRGP